MFSLRSIPRAGQRPVRSAIVIIFLFIFGYCLQPIILPHSIPNFPGISKDDSRLFASRAIDNTVVIVPVNTGMLHWVENLLCSLNQTSFDISNVVFWTLDKGAKQVLDRSGFATYYDPHLYNVASNENHKGNTRAYKRMMRERPKFFINILKAGFDVLLIDIDIVFWQSPLSFLLPSDNKEGVDAIFSTDAREFYQSHNAFEDARRQGSYMPPICNGMFWMRSNHKTIALWTRMLEIFNERGPLGWYHQRHVQDDQRGMDVLLNDGRAQIVPPYPDGMKAEDVPTPTNRIPDLKIRLLDQTSVVNGHLLTFHKDEYERNLADLRARGKDRIAAHFNWNTNELTKEEGSKMFEMSFVDSEGVCKFGAISQGSHRGL